MISKRWLFVIGLASLGVVVNTCDFDDGEMSDDERKEFREDFGDNLDKIQRDQIRQACLNNPSPVCN